MSLGKYTKRLLGLTIGIGLLAILACGPSEEAEPTATSTATPIPAMPTFDVGQPTPTPPPPAPGEPTPTPVTSVPAPADTPTPVPAPGDQPKYGGVVNLPLTGNANYWDQLHGSTGYGWATLANTGNLFGQFIRPNLQDRVTIEGDLAESWQITDGGKTWILTMRDGVIDHDGNPFTVEDAYYSLYRIIERPNGVVARRWGCMRDYLNPIVDDSMMAVENPGAEITGPRELTIRQPVAKGAFAACFLSGFGAITPDTYAKAIDEDTSTGYRDFDFEKGEVVGTGPFKIVGGEMGNVWRAERHDGYFREGLPYLDGYNMFAIPTGTTRVANFRVGRIDAAEIFTGTASFGLRAVLDLQSAIGEEAAFPIVAAPGWRGFELNVTRPPFGPLDDPTATKVRQAIQYVMNRGDMNTLCHDGIGFFSTPYFIGVDWVYTQQEWFDNMNGLDPDPMKKEEDFAKAISLMEEAGYSDSNRISATLLLGRGADCRADLVVNTLRGIYIDVVKDNVPDGSANREKAVKKEFDLRLESKGASFVDPDAFAISIHPTFENGGFTFGGWENPRWLELQEEQVLLTDPAERAPLLREMADILWNQDAAWVGMVRPGLLQGHRGNWRGWTPVRFHASNYSIENVWLADEAENPYPPLPSI
jgi:peptide/nickel transport system substrate-binding protein